MSRTPNSPYGGLECVSKLKAELKRVCVAEHRGYGHRTKAQRRKGRWGKNRGLGSGEEGGGSHVHGILRIIIFNSQ